MVLTFQQRLQEERQRKLFKKNRNTRKILGASYFNNWVVSHTSNIHVVNNKDWFQSKRYFEASVEIHDSEGRRRIDTTIIGDVELQVEADDGLSQEIHLEHVFYIPGFPCNIFSLVAEEGVGVGGDRLYQRTSSGKSTVAICDKHRFQRIRLTKYSPDDTCMDDYDGKQIRAMVPNATIVKLWGLSESEYDTDSSISELGDEGEDLEQEESNSKKVLERLHRLNNMLSGNKEGALAVDDWLTWMKRSHLTIKTIDDVSENCGSTTIPARNIEIEALTAPLEPAAEPVSSSTAHIEAEQNIPGHDALPDLETLSLNQPSLGQPEAENSVMVPTPSFAAPTGPRNNLNRGPNENWSRYTPEERRWLKRKSRSEFHFLQAHGLNIKSFMDRAQGRAIVRQNMNAAKQSKIRQNSTS